MSTYLGIHRIALFWIWTVSADILGWTYLYLYLCLNRCICICICIWIKVEQNICICICIWKIQIFVFVFVFVFDKTYLTPALPLAKEILVENIPLAKENFLIMSPFLHDFKEFQPKYSLFKRNFPKTDAFYGFSGKKYPWLPGLRKKTYPWLRNLGSKSDPWERHTPRTIHITSAPPGDTDYDQIVTGTFSKTCQHSLKKLSFRCHWQFQTSCLQNQIR